MDNISIIANNSSSYQSGFNVSSIDEDQKIVYLEGSTTTVVDNSSDIRTAATHEYLNELLESRNYNLIGSRRIQFLGNDGTDDVTQTNLCISMMDSEGSIIDFPIVSTISDSEYENIISLNENILRDELSNTRVVGDGELDDDNMKRYYNFSMIRDFVEHSTTANVLSMLKDPYVDVINLNTVRSMITSDRGSRPASVKIGIQYTDKDGFVNFQDLVFEVDNDFHHVINDEVTIEVHDNCIRLFNSDSVVESIITYCYLFYNGIL